MVTKLGVEQEQLLAPLVLLRYGLVAKLVALQGHWRVGAGRYGTRRGYVGGGKRHGTRDQMQELRKLGEAYAEMPGPKISEVTHETLLKRHGGVIFHKFHQENTGNLNSKKCKPLDKMALCVPLALSNPKTLKWTKLAVFFGQ